MTTQHEPFPEGYDGRSLSQQLEELGKQLGFYLEEPRQTSGSPSPAEPMTLKIITIYHQVDAKLLQQLSRHLELLEVPGGQIEWSSLRLTHETGELFIERYRTQLEQTHLVLLLISIDLVEALVKKSPKLYQTLSDLGEDTVVFPILLRPVFWACVFPTLEPTPSRAISLWKNQDAAHVAVAKKLSGVLEGIKTFLEDGGETQN